MAGVPTTVIEKPAIVVCPKPSKLVVQLAAIGPAYGNVVSASVPAGIALAREKGRFEVAIDLLHG